MAESARVRLGVESDAGAVGDSPHDHPVPMLTQEQYRFLRFLFRMADDLEIEGVDGRWVRRPLHDRRRQRALSRMRSALLLFELPTGSRGDGGTREQPR